MSKTKTDSPKKNRRTDAEIADAHRRDADYRDARSAATRERDSVYQFWSDAVQRSVDAHRDIIEQAKTARQNADAEYDAAIKAAQAIRDGLTPIDVVAITEPAAQEQPEGGA